MIRLIETSSLPVPLLPGWLDGEDGLSPGDTTPRSGRGLGSPSSLKPLIPQEAPMGDLLVLCVADQLENGDSILKPFRVNAPVINVNYDQYPHHVRVDFADHSTMWLKPHMELVVERLS